jgi:hypothetical protein
VCRQQAGRLEHQDPFQRLKVVLQITAVAPADHHRAAERHQVTGKCRATLFVPERHVVG